MLHGTLGFGSVPRVPPELPGTNLRGNPGDTTEQLDLCQGNTAIVSSLYANRKGEE
jgi:hypothetical protein